MEGNSEMASIPIKIKEEPEDFPTDTVTDVFKDEGKETLEIKEEGVFSIEEADPLYLKGETVRGPHVCVVCKQRFAQIDRLRKHLFTENHRKKILKCDICKEPFVFARYLQKHKEMVHNEGKKTGLKCTICKQTFSRVESLRLHKQTHYVYKESFMCHFCNKLYFAKEDLLVHKRTHDITTKETFECDICNKSYFTKTDLWIHRRKHGDAMRESLRCDVCEKTYASRTALTEHKRLHDITEVKGCFKCDVCDNTYLSKLGLRLHRKTHDAQGTGRHPIGESFERGVCVKTYSVRRQQDAQHRIEG